MIAFPTFLGFSLFPILLRYKNDVKKMNEKIKFYSVILFLSGIVLTVIILTASPLLVLLGENYKLTILPLQILSISLPFFFLTSLFQWVLLLKNKVKILIFVYAFTMLINLVLNIIYIPMYSYFSSSVITVITEALVLLLMIGSFSLTGVKNSSKVNDN
jgi:O-antigen/teichoic acid export membrane protein